MSLTRTIRRALGAAQTARGPRALLWGSWSNLERQQLEELRSAGLQEVIYNINDVTGGGRRWDWVGNSRSRVLRRLATAREAGLNVSVMPWCWSNPAFFQMCGQEVTRLEQDHGERFRHVQLDWEGHAEHDAKRQVGRLKDSKGNPVRTIPKVVALSLRALVRELRPDTRLGITTLYFRRPAGDAAIRWSWTDPETGRAWTIAEWDGQMYGVWLPGNSRKARSTHTPQYQPPGLIHTGHRNYRPLFGHLERVRLGFPLWALERTSDRVPLKLRQSAAQALDNHIEPGLALGFDGFCGWAGHLMSGKSATHRKRFALALRAYERVTRGGPRVWTPPAQPQQQTEAHIRWSEAYYDPRLATQEGQVFPAGYRWPKAAGVSAGGLGPIGTQVLRRWHSEGRELGWVVPVTFRGLEWVCVIQEHPWTRRNGKRVDYNGPGASMGVRTTT